MRIARPLSSGEEVVTTKQVAGRAGVGSGCNSKTDGDTAFLLAFGIFKGRQCVVYATHFVSTSVQ